MATVEREVEEIIGRRQDVDPDSIRGLCPCCREAVFSEIVYHQGKGYLLRWRCTGTLDEPATCDYIRIL